MTAADFLLGLFVRLAFFRRNSQHYRKSKARNGKNHVNHRALWHAKTGTPRPPQNLHPCRGLALLGRWGPETGRWGGTVDGKTQYFRNGDCAVPEREAGVVSGLATPLGQVGHRAAARPSIYAGFASPAFEFANTIEDVGRRIAVRPSIYTGFAPSAAGFAQTVKDAGRRIAACQSIYV